MDDRSQTKDQLLYELRQLCERLSELEGIETRCVDISGAKAQETLYASLKQIMRAKQEWETTADALPQLVFLLDRRGRILRANRTVEDWKLGQPGDVRGREIHDLLHPHCANLACPLKNAWSHKWANLTEGISSECEVWDDLQGRWLRCQARRIVAKDTEDHRQIESFAVVVIEDITEHKRAREAQRLNESRLKALIELGQMTESSLSQIADYVLTKAVELTQSEIGFIGFLSADETWMDIHAWSETAMAECTVADIPAHFAIDKAGIWGEAVRQHRPIIVNDYAASHPHKRGCPKGHVHIARLLTVPVFDQDRTIAVVAVGNKETEYDESDVRQLTLLLDGMRKLVSHRQMQDALRESESNLSALIENTDGSIWSVDRNYRLIVGNSAFFQNALKMYGHPFAPGDSLLSDHLPPSVLNKSQKCYDRALRGEQFSIVTRGFVTDTLRYAEYNFSPIHAPDGSVTGVTAYGRDITERKQAEEALRKSERQKNLILNSTTEMVAYYDMDLRVIWANRASSKSVGRSPEELVGLHCYEIWHQRNEPCTDCPIIRVRDEKIPYQGEQQTPDGRYWFLRGYPIFDSQGEMVGLVEFGQDITKRKQVEKERIRSQRLLLALSQAAQAVQRARTPQAVYRAIGEQVARLGFDIAVFTPSDDQTHLIVSHLNYKSKLMRAAEKLTGLPAESYHFPIMPGGLFRHVIDSGETFFTCIDADHIASILPEPVHPLANQLFSLLATERAIYVPLRINGDTTGVLTVMGPELTQADVPGVTAFANQAAIALDNARLYESLNQQQRKLRDLAARLAMAEETERARLVRELHDQIGQNLTALGINLNIIQSQSHGQTKELIDSHLADSLTLVEQTTARVRSLMADLRPPVLDDYGLVAALRWLSEQTATRMDIEVSILGKTLHPRLADTVETSLFRIAQEALSNVLKHTSATQVTITIQECNGLVCMTIQDNGAGFDLAKQPDTDGHWGLLIMRERAEAAGGTCHIESSPGEGTSVRVEVPR